MISNKAISIQVEKGKIVTFPIDKLLQMLKQVTDLRDDRGKRYPLPYLLGSVLLAKLAGEQEPEGVREWIAHRWEALAELFEHVRYIAPCLNTIREVLAHSFWTEELQSCLRQYLFQTFGGQHSVLVVLDGKTLRGTIPKGETQGVHLLAAYLPEEGIVLAQELVDSKENEIVVAAPILKQIDLKGRIVIGDAMFTQRTLSVQIQAQGGHYIWYVKENQPTLLADVQRFFQPAEHAAGWHVPPLAQEVVSTVQKGHGRLEKRILTRMVDTESYLQWPALAQLFELKREVTCLRTGQQTTTVTYGITSLPPDMAQAQHLLAYTQAAWGIENGLHYRRDVTLAEDSIRMKWPDAAEATAVLNNFIVGLALKMGFDNLAAAIRAFDAHINRFLWNLL